MKDFRKLNLQRFTTSLPAGSTDLKTANTNTYEGKKAEEVAVYQFVDRALKKSIYEEYNLEQYFDTMPLPKNSGKTITWRKLLRYDAKVNDLVEGVVPPADAPQGVIDYTIHVGSLGGYTTFTDDLDIFSIDNGNVARIADEQGSSVGEKLNLRLRDILYSTTNRWYAGAGTTVPVSLSAARNALTNFQLDDLRFIKAFLTRNHVAPYKDGAYLVLVPPEVEQSLFSLSKSASDGKYTFVEIQNYRASQLKEIFPGEIGAWMNFRIVANNALGQLKDASGNGITNSSSKEVFGCLILGKYKGHKGASVVKLEGYGKPQTIIKNVDDGGAKENPLNQIGSVGWKMKGFGGAVLYDEAVMVYECTSDMDELVYNEDDIAKGRDEFVKGSTGKVTGYHDTDEYGEIVPEADAPITKGAKNSFIVGKNRAGLPGQDYTITFAAGTGASGTMASIGGVVGEYTLPACTFTAPTNKVFDGWKIGATDVVKAVGETIEVTADITLTATWDSE